MKTILSFSVGLLFLGNISAQSLSGKVTSSKKPVGGVTVGSTAMRDTSIKGFALTDANGDYTLINPLATSSQDIHEYEDEMTIIHNSDKDLTVNIKTDDPVRDLNLIGINGSIYATEQLRKIGDQEYQTRIQIPNQIGDQVLILSDGVHKGTKISTLNKPSNGVQTVKLNELGMKSGSLEENNNVRITIDEPEGQDNYQPFDTTITINPDFENYFDPILKLWPLFNSNTTINLKSEKGNPVSNANITLTEKNSQDKYTLTTDANGNASANIEIPNYAENKLKPDTLEFLLNAVAEGYQDFNATIKGITNKDTTITFNDLKEIVQEQAYAYLWRAIEDPILRQGTRADIIIANEQFNYRDTIFNVANKVAWRDTVPVNKIGDTEYTIIINPRVREGSIPLHQKIVKLNLKENQTAQGFDKLVALAQEQKVNLYLKYSDTKELIQGGVDIVIYDENGNQLDSIRNNTGELQIGPYQVRRNRLTLNAHLVNDQKNKYFSHRRIPIGDANVDSKMGQIYIENSVLTNMNDSITNHTIEFQRNEWKDPITGEMVLLNPTHLGILEGTSYNIGWALWGEQRMYLKPSSTNTTWPVEFGKFIERNTGVPYKVIVVDEPFDMSNATVIKSLDDKEYLESVRDKIGINVESKYENAGYTQAGGYSTIEGIQIHTTGDIEIFSPEPGKKPTNYMIAATSREFFTRYEKLNEISKEYYKSFSNLTTPKDLDSTNMIYDFANIAIIYEHYKSRINKESNSGFATLVPSEDKYYYDANVHNSDDFKGWDTPENCPEQNKKFFNWTTTTTSGFRSQRRAE